MNGGEKGGWLLDHAEHLLRLFVARLGLALELDLVEREDRNLGCRKKGVECDQNDLNENLPYDSLHDN
jgi:hypothetical protein